MAISQIDTIIICAAIVAANILIDLYAIRWEQKKQTEALKKIAEILEKVKK